MAMWIPKLGKIVKKLIHDCARCKLHKGSKYHIPKSPPLPNFRVEDADPYTFVGVDMTGHFWVKIGEETVKRYIIIFTCATSRAVHLEIARDASAKAFANCFIRFTSKCGSPRLMISDQGSNLKSFAKDLVDISEDSFTKNTLIKKGVEWKFIPIRAPFMGGFWERLIGIVKNIIKKSIQKKLLTLDEFTTIVAYAECCVNDRPLNYISMEDESIIPMTPNMLVYGRNLNFNTKDITNVDLQDKTYEFGTKNNLNKICKRLKSTLIQVRKNWISDYLTSLRERDALRNKMSPANEYTLTPKAGDVVLISEDKDMKLGRIEKLVVSADGEVRSAKVYSKGGNGIHSLKNLRHIESIDLKMPIDNELQSETIKTVDRPRRKAAIKAQEKWLISHLLTSLEPK